MASFSEMFSGRKRSSSVWTNFSYDEKQKKSKCLVSDCSMFVATKNPTNLKNHLMKHHRDVYDEMLSVEQEQKTQCNASKKMKIDGKFLLIISLSAEF